MSPHKSRYVALTDIGLFAHPEDAKDPDDFNSIIRLLLYSNEIDIEALVATKAAQRLPEGPIVGAFPETIHKAVDAYEEVYPNLLAHADGYPTADFLRQRIKMGNPVKEVSWGRNLDDFSHAIGEGRDSEASDFIIEVLDKEDERPIWFGVWGKIIDLGQALWKLRRTRDADEARSLCSKIRIYDIEGQDNVGSWIAKNFPAIKYYRSIQGFKGIDMNGAGDQSVFTDEWVKTHVQSHGPLGRIYPDHPGHQKEGDTPSFLHMIRNGISDPESLEWGGWAGRFSRGKIKNVRGGWARDTDGVNEPFYMYRNLDDEWFDPQRNEIIKNHLAPIARWRVHFQNDFAARMDWSLTKDYAAVNHPPIAAFDGDVSGKPIRLSAKTGDEVLLSAEGSSDPDGDALSFHWFVYPEPSCFEGELEIEGHDRIRSSFIAPQGPAEIHIILQVTDQGEPPLTRYRRIIVDLAS